jgi:UDP-N-acetylmuramyl pentapeptide synthase
VRSVLINTILSNPLVEVVLVCSHQVANFLFFLLLLTKVGIPIQRCDTELSEIGNVRGELYCSGFSAVFVVNTGTIY